jgi:predicted phage terminase large subunit-like protein
MPAKTLRRSKRKISRRFTPNSLQQEKFIASRANIAVYGGAAGGGKTFGLLLHTLAYRLVHGFRGVVLRRSLDEITKPGGLWDEASSIYPEFGATPNLKDYIWRFPSGARLDFDHLQYEQTLAKWRSAQIAALYYDQLETFTATQWWYMFSRIRSLSGVEPYIRATANPDPDSFLFDDGSGPGTGLLGWWIDARTGYAIPARDGQVRWFVRYDEQLVWGDSKEDLYRQLPNVPPKHLRPLSLTFIRSTVYDNVDLINENPGYLANLLAMTRVDRLRLLGHPILGGNWLVKPTAGNIFRKSMFRVVPVKPVSFVALVRHWDLAATKKRASNDPDWTCGTLMGMDAENRVWLLDQERLQEGSHEVEQRIQNVASLDGNLVSVSLEQEGGASGKGWPESIIRNRLQGFIAAFQPPPGDKVSRAKILASQAALGSVYVYNALGRSGGQAPWIAEFLNECENFPDARHDDRVDSACGAYEQLAGSPMGLWKIERRPTPRSNDVFGLGIRQEPGLRDPEDEGGRRPFNERDMPPDVFMT